MDNAKNKLIANKDIATKILSILSKDVKINPNVSKELWIGPYKVSIKIQ